MNPLIELKSFLEPEAKKMLDRQKELEEIIKSAQMEWKMIEDKIGLFARIDSDCEEYINREEKLMKETFPSGVIPFVDSYLDQTPAEVIDLRKSGVFGKSLIFIREFIPENVDICKEIHKIIAEERLEGQVEFTRHTYMDSPYTSVEFVKLPTEKCYKTLLSDIWDVVAPMAKQPEPSDQRLPFVTHREDFQ